MVAKFSKTAKTPFKRIFFPVLLGLLLVAVIGFLGFTDWRISKRRSQLAVQLQALEEEIQKVEAQNKSLKANIDQAGEAEYLEKIGREQLNLKGQGEEVVVISKESEKQNAAQDKENKKSSWDPRTWWEWIRGAVRD